MEELTANGPFCETPLIFSFVIAAAADDELPASGKAIPAFNAQAAGSGLEPPESQGLFRSISAHESTKTKARVMVAAIAISVKCLLMSYSFV
jgi:hypothetical protein